MKQIKLYVVGGQKYIASFLRYSFDFVDDIKNANLVIFTGGEDVDPSLYYCKKHHSTYSNIDRDLFELKKYNEALSSKNKPLIIGICRGSQFLVVANGGKLIQNVSNHLGNHYVSTIDGKKLVVSSTHHQMHYPYDLPSTSYKMLAWASEKQSKFYEGDGIAEEKVIKESEILYFPDTKCLCIQGHPEMCDKDSQFVVYVNKLIKKSFKKSL